MQGTFKFKKLITESDYDKSNFDVINYCFKKKLIWKIEYLQFL